MTITGSSSSIKDFPHSNNKGTIWKKLILVGDTMFLPIHESIIQQLHIDEQCWLEQVPTSEGIFLKISSKKIEPSHDLIEVPVVDKQK